jgi:hypothetical protein
MIIAAVLRDEHEGVSFGRAFQSLPAGSTHCVLFRGYIVEGIRVFKKSITDVTLNHNVSSVTASWAATRMCVVVCLLLLT